MGFAKESGYTPASIAAIMDTLRVGINSKFGTAYTAENFIGTNWYKFAYALAQRMQDNEVKTAEIFAKLQQYFAITNERILRPVATNPGIIEALEAAGFIASVKAMVDANAGKLHVCVNVNDGDRAAGTVTITSYANLLTGTPDTVTVGATVFTAQSGAVTPGDATFRAATSNALTATSLAAQINAHATASALVKAVAVGAVVQISARAGGTGGNAIALAYHDLGTATVGATVSGATLTGGTTRSAYAAEKLQICTFIKDSSAAGVVSQGTQVESIALSNGQTFDFKFNLPDRSTISLRLTTTLSENNQLVILSPEEQKQILLDNIAARYRLGKDFEPQRYFSTVDAPWAAATLLEWSDDFGTNWHSEIYDAEYDALFEFSLANVTLVES